MGYRTHPVSKTGCWRPISCDARQHGLKVISPESHSRMMSIVVISSLVKLNVIWESILPFCLESIRLYVTTLL